jgi:hypothetical protein
MVLLEEILRTGHERHFLSLKARGVVSRGERWNLAISERFEH